MSRFLIAAGAAAVIAACAQIQGLDSYEKVDCLGDCADAQATPTPTPTPTPEPETGVPEAAPTCPPCSGATPVCDPVSLKCVECLAGKLECASGQFCDADPALGFHCVQGCAVVADCVRAYDAGTPDADAGDADPGDAGDAGDAGALSFLACCNNRCVDTRSSVAHCGVCGNACTVGSLCCDSTCTDVASNKDDCGGCGLKCSTTNVSTLACTIGKCSSACTAGFDDCNNDKLTDGCESDIYNDPLKCGACNKACSNNHITTPTCSTGTCNGACDTDYADCNGNKLVDGCESHLPDDKSNCGACGNLCSNNHITTPTCTAGVCNGACDLGWSDCNGNKLTNGCETNTATDVGNCGGCGVVCSSNHIPTRTCNAGVCDGVCATGYDDCNANKRTDGCETFIGGTDVNNCGACNASCSNKHTTCSAGACTTTCQTGWTDCNANAGDGCESNLTIDTLNCNACGSACPTAGTRNCVGGACTAGYGQTFAPVTFIDACAQAGVTPTTFSNQDDAVTAALALPINFTFYGSAVTTYWYNTNGVLGFGTPIANTSYSCLPYTTFPGGGAAILGFGRDLYTRTNTVTKTGICAATIGATVGSRKQVVTWKDSTYCCTPTDSNHLTFSIILDEATNQTSVVFQTTTGFQTGSGTIGIQNAGGTLGTSFSCPSAPRPIGPGTSITFIP